MPELTFSDATVTSTGERVRPTDPDNKDAPFGYNDDGTVLAPYGIGVNGKPKTTNRGRRAGNSGISKRAKSNRQQVDLQRKSALMQLSEVFIEAPLAAASTSTFVAKRLGDKQADALAADALIWNYYSASLADGLIMYSAQKPRVLTWLDGVQEKAPLLMLAQVGVQMAKAIIGNHMEPDPRIAATGRRLVRLNAAKMAAAINAEAEAMGIPTDDEMIAQMREQTRTDNGDDAAA